MRLRSALAATPDLLLHPSLPDEPPWKLLLPVLALAFAARAAVALSGDFVLHPDEIDGVRASVGLGPYAWTDPVLAAGSTRVRLVHLLEMRWALAPVFAAKAQRPPF